MSVCVYCICEYIVIGVCIDMCLYYDVCIVICIYCSVCMCISMYVSMDGQKIMKLIPFPSLDGFPGFTRFAW